MNQNFESGKWPWCAKCGCPCQGWESRVGNSLKHSNVLVVCHGEREHKPEYDDMANGIIPWGQTFKMSIDDYFIKLEDQWDKSSKDDTLVLQGADGTLYKFTGVKIVNIE